MSANPCRECGTTTCHRTPINPFCAATVYTACEVCKRKTMVRGDHYCKEVEA